MNGNGKHRMYADFTKDAYSEYLAGRAELNNNGFRSIKGNYMSDQPEYSEIESSEGNAETTDDSNLLVVAIVAAISIGGTLVATKAAPHIKLWWNDKAYPSILSKWRKLIRKEERTQYVKSKNSSQIDRFELTSQEQKDNSRFFIANLKYFGGGGFVEEKYASLQNEKVKGYSMNEMVEEIKASMSMENMPLTEDAVQLLKVYQTVTNDEKNNIRNQLIAAYVEK